MSRFSLDNTLDENLRPVKVSGNKSALEISTEKVRVKDLQVTGDTEGVLDNSKLPLSGGTMTGNISHAGNFRIDVEGDLSFDANGGNISLLDNGSVYTPTSASDAVPLHHMPYVLYSQFQDDMGINKHYLPLRGYFEQSSVGGEPTGIVSPFNLKLQKAIMRCSEDISGGTWKLGMWAIDSGTTHTHHHTTNMNWVSATGGVADTNAIFDFTGTVGLSASSSGGSNAVTAGQWIDLALQSDTDVTSSSAEFWITFFFIADLSNTI